LSLRQRPRPEPDRDSAPWWQAVRRHELLVQQCDGCGARRFPARAICNRCRSRDASWVPSAGTGRVVSWIVTHQVFMPALADEAPLPILLVRLDDGDGIHMYGNLDAPAHIEEGTPVEAVFADVDDDFTLVQWRPIR
jgi:uncharacterized OB-fold protein